MGAGFSQPTISWSTSQSDMILKIDAKLKVCASCHRAMTTLNQSLQQKLTVLLLKDLDTLARKAIQDELASLLGNSVVTGDPTLSNGSGKSLYDYEG